MRNADDKMSALLSSRQIPAELKQSLKLFFDPVGNFKICNDWKELQKIKALSDKANISRPEFFNMLVNGDFKILAQQSPPEENFTPGRLQKYAGFGDDSFDA
jgi:hypothetical protein